MAIEYRVRRGRALPGRATVVRVAVPAVYAAVAVTVFALRGVPLERGQLTVWILGALLCLSLGSLGGFVRSVVLEWLPLLAALTLYDVLRGAGGGRFPIHGEYQIWLDRHLFGAGSVPTVWLQRHLWHPGRLTWWDVAAWATYVSYFLLTPVVLGIFWLTNRARFRSYARRLTLLSFGAVAVFTVWPSIPPWLASAKGMIGPSDRLVGPIGSNFAWFDATALWERGLRLANDLAAFPSLHEGMTVLLVLMVWRHVPRWARVPLAAYPLVMAFALVYLAEHYVTDLVAGAACAALVVWAEPRLLRAAQSAWARRGLPRLRRAAPDLALADEELGTAET